MAEMHIKAITRALTDFRDAISNFFREICNIPHRIAEAVKHAARTAWRAILAAILYVTKLAIKGLIILVALVVVTYLTRKSWQGLMKWMRQREVRRAVEAAQRNFEQHARELEAQRREIERRQEQERMRKAREQERRKAEEARQFQQETRRQAALAELQRKEDLRKYEQWRLTCDSMFRLPENCITEFPEPYHWDCQERRCNQSSRYLRACEHSVRRLCAATGNLQKTLGEERHRWHPNRARGKNSAAVFHTVADEQLKMKALELSQVLQQLVDEAANPT